MLTEDLTKRMCNDNSETEKLRNKRYTTSKMDDQIGSDCKERNEEQIYELQSKNSMSGKDEVKMFLS